MVWRVTNRKLIALIIWKYKSECTNVGDHHFLKHTLGHWDFNLQLQTCFAEDSPLGGVALSSGPAS